MNEHTQTSLMLMGAVCVAVMITSGLYVSYEARLRREDTASMVGVAYETRHDMALFKEWAYRNLKRRGEP